MRVSRRRLDVGADGKASVLLLTDPIPRHLSIVSWGANDTPAASWKSADGLMIANHTLRAPPGPEVTNASTVTGADLTNFLNETMTAWVAATASVLGKSIEAGDRAAQIRGLTVQAGARVAAAATALGAAAAKAATSHKVLDLALPALPAHSTLQGEIDRRQFVASLELAAASLIDGSMRIMKNGVSVTETILHLFSDAADAFSQWAGSMPRGVVGVATSEKSQMRVSTKDAGKVVHVKGAGRMSVTTVTTVGLEKVRETSSVKCDGYQAQLGDWTGAVYKFPVSPERGTPIVYEPSQSDQEVSAREKALKELVAKRGSSKKSETISPSSSEKTMTLADLQRLAEEDPTGLLATIKTAIVNAKAADASFKFVWGETGDTPYDVDQVLSLLKQQGGADLTNLIFGSVGGINLDSVGADNTQVASAFKSVIASAVRQELKSSEAFRTAVIEALAPSIGEAVAGTVKAAFDNGGEAGGTGSFDFSVDDEELDLTADLPGQRR